LSPDAGVSLEGELWSMRANSAALALAGGATDFTANASSDTVEEISLTREEQSGQRWQCALIASRPFESRVPMA
ncbi:MAG: hypothetical protein AB7G88_08180, partial [Thermomicrobiales bacterium]